MDVIYNWRRIFIHKYLTIHSIIRSILIVTFPNNNETIVFKCLYGSFSLLILGICINLKFSTRFFSILSINSTEYTIIWSILIPAISCYNKPSIWKASYFREYLCLISISVYSKLRFEFISLCSKHLTIHSSTRSILTKTTPYYNKSSIL